MKLPLIVAAHQSELSAFPIAHPKVNYLITGVGKIRATAVLTQHLTHRHEDISEIIVVGTAVSTDERGSVPPVGTVFSIISAWQHDVVDEQGRGGHHVSLPQRVSCGGGETSISTGDSFITDTSEIRELHRYAGVRLADMETYAYAWVARQWGIPIRVFKAVSDSGDAAEWDENVAECSLQLAGRLQTEGVFG